MLVGRLRLSVHYLYAYSKPVNALHTVYVTWKALFLPWSTTPMCIPSIGSHSPHRARLHNTNHHLVPARLRSSHASILPADMLGWRPPLLGTNVNKPTGLAPRAVHGNPVEQWACDRPLPLHRAAKADPPLSEQREQVMLGGRHLTRSHPCTLVGRLALLRGL